jgi:hypothetical protein
MVSTIDSLYFYCAMMREHHHHFQRQKYKKSGTMQNLSDLFLTKEGGRWEGAVTGCPGQRFAKLT